jgi:hypothetical protein
MYDSFVRYQTRLILVFDRLSTPYGFEVVDAGRPAEEVFEALQAAISSILAPHRAVKAARRATGRHAAQEKRPASRPNGVAPSVRLSSWSVPE